MIQWMFLDWNFAVVARPRTGHHWYLLNGKYRTSAKKKEKEEPKQMIRMNHTRTKRFVFQLVSMPIQQASTAIRYIYIQWLKRTVRCAAHIHRLNAINPQTHLRRYCTMSIQSQPPHAYHARRYDARLKTLQNIRWLTLTDENNKNETFIKPMNCSAIISIASFMIAECCTLPNRKFLTKNRFVADFGICDLLSNWIFLNPFNRLTVYRKEVVQRNIRKNVRNLILIVNIKYQIQKYNQYNYTINPSAYIKVANKNNCEKKNTNNIFLSRMLSLYIRSFSWIFIAFCSFCISFAFFSIWSLVATEFMVNCMISKG